MKTHHMIPYNFGLSNARFHKFMPPSTKGRVEMTVQLLNTETDEVRQWDYERPVTKRTLKTRVARYIAWDNILCDADDYRNHLLLLPAQELVPGEIMDLLTVFVKYAPVIAIPNDSGDGYFFIQGNRRMRIFSLRNGDFVSTEDTGLQKPYTLMSVKSLNSDGFAYEAKEVLENTRAIWESKLMLTPSAYRNTIREKSDNLSATDDEVLAEAYVRLRLLKLSQDCHSLFHGLIPHSEQKRCGKASIHAPEPCINKEGSALYNDGLHCGICITYEKMGEEKPIMLDGYYSTTIVNYKDDVWKLSSPSESEKLVSQIKDIEKEYGIFVYYYNYIPKEYNAKELCMLYVGRDMDGWASARERTASGIPDACFKNAGSGECPDFESAKISTLSNMAFRAL